jgi:homopolymeric O-antigen transport system ATP-binding protein
MRGDVAIAAQGIAKRYRVRPHVQQIGVAKRIQLAAAGIGQRAAGRPVERSRDIWALRDVSFEVGRGEVLGVLGKNGAGKSTLLAVLAGVTAPTAGRAELRGRVSALLGIGTGFHPELTGRDNVLLNGVILGMTRAEVARKFDEIAAFADIGDFIDLPVRLYSSGMGARLMFAVAAHVEPDILLLDEVLGVGDFEFREKCNQAIDRMVESGLTGVLVTHDMTAVRRLCSRAIVLDHGKIAFSGSTEEAVECYTQLPGGGESVRTRRHDLRIADVVVEAADGAPNVVTAKPLAIRVRLKSDYARWGRSVVLQILVTDPRGRPLTFMSTRGGGDDPLRDARIEDEVWLACVLDGLPLRPGEYMLNLKLSEGAELVDELRNVGFLVVSDELGGGQLSVLSPPIVVGHQWQLEPRLEPVSVRMHR